MIQFIKAFVKWVLTFFAKAFFVLSFMVYSMANE